MSSRPSPRSSPTLSSELAAWRGAFETLRVYRGAPFAYRRHFRRLAAAAAELEIAAPDPEHVRQAVDDVVQADRLVDARVRITLLAGRGDRAPDVVVGAGALPARRARARVAIAPWPRNERGATVGMKSTSYADNVRALTDARSHGADECVFANTRGELCEGTGSNVFVVSDGAVLTPPESSGCLLGVTRALVIELAESAGIAVEQVAIPLEALGSADEAFLTSTTREVQPIGHIEGRGPVPAPGPVTRRLEQLFAQLVAHDLDP